VTADAPGAWADAPDASGAWADPMLAARLLASDRRLGGAVVRSPAGPARDAWLAAYRAAATAPVTRLPLGVDDDRLLGGIDLTATLASGRPVATRGLLADAAGGTIVVAMAERLDAALAGRLAAALDSGDVRLVLFDEGEGDEAVPAALAERCALWLTLPARLSAEANSVSPPAASPPAADAVATLCATAFDFGVDSARAAVFAIRAARGLAGSDGPTEADLATAARLVLLPRATRLPAPPESADAPPEPPADAPPPDDDSAGDDREREPDAAELAERIVAAAAATLPPGLVAGPRRRARRRAGTCRAGRRQRGTAQECDARASLA